MQDAKKISKAFFEGISYGLTGTIFVFLAIWAMESFAEITSNSNGISFSNDDFGREGIGVIPLFLGLSISVVSVISILGEQKNNLFLRWLAILLLSVTLTVVLQKIFLIYYFHQPIEKLFNLLKNEQERLGLWWAIRLFLILAPFTVLFANRRLIFEKIRNLNSLK
jgi:hypothetical protein